MIIFLLYSVTYSNMEYHIHNQQKEKNKKPHHLAFLWIAKSLSIRPLWTGFWTQQDNELNSVSCVALCHIHCSGVSLGRALPEAKNTSGCLVLSILHGRELKECIHVSCSYLLALTRVPQPLRRCVMSKMNRMWFWGCTNWVKCILIDKSWHFLQDEIEKICWQ